MVWFIWSPNFRLDILKKLWRSLLAEKLSIKKLNYCVVFNKGVLIPSYIDAIRGVKTDAVFTLIVEKDATFQRLIDDGFLIKFPAILITV